MKIVLALLFLATSSFAVEKSYTPLGYSTLRIEAVMQTISILSSEEYATNPWPGYIVKNIEAKENGLIVVTVNDAWAEKTRVLNFEFEVKEKDCNFSVCGFEASLLQ